jgi:hypothetical protein
MFDRMSIVTAWYLALSHCHSGQGSRSYARLCKIESYFRPSMWLSFESLSEDEVEIYNAACARIIGEAW